MSNVSIGQMVFFLLTPFSHIGASLFMARPRFGKLMTTGIWLLYGALMMFLPPDMPTFNFFFSLAVHWILFSATTTGGMLEKGFLFLSYAIIYMFFSVSFTIVNTRLQGELLKIVLAVLLITLMQVLLYRVLVPSFRKVTQYLHTGWGKYYAVVLGFFALIIVQVAFPLLAPMTNKEIIIYLLTAMTFLITYITVFSSMKNMVELAREKQRQTHTELLISQVQSQAKEAERVRQNRHDMRHHYQQLLAYAESGETDKLKDYLKRQTERIDNIASWRFCENETVNNILRVYSQKAADNGINMDICAAAKRDLSAAAPDLVAIIANVLENALHGAQKSGSSAPFIRVNIRHKAQRFVIRCENACAPDMDFEDMPEELRGVGIHSITSTADQYGGDCLLSAKNGVFRCTVVMDE